MKKSLSIIIICILFSSWSNAQFLQRTIDIAGTHYDYSEIVDMQTQRAPVTSIPHALINVSSVENMSHFQLLEMDPNDGTPTQHYDFAPDNSIYGNVNAVAFEIRSSFYFVTGTVVELATSSKKMFVMKIQENNGSIVWFKAMDTDNEQRVFDIDVDAYGSEIYLTGTEQVGGYSHLFVTRLDAVGSTVWHRRLIEGHRDTEGRSIDYVNADEIYIAGSSTSQGSVMISGRLLKINNSGTVLVNERITFFDGGSQLRLRSIYMQKYGTDVYMMAQTWAGPSHPGTIFFRRMDTGLNQLVYRRYTSISGDQPTMNSVAMRNNQILISGVADIGSGGDGFIQASFDLLGNDLTAVNYTNMNLSNAFGSSHSVFLSGTRSFMLGMHNSYSQGTLFEEYADLNLRTYCDEHVISLPETYQSREVLEVSVTNNAPFSPMIDVDPYNPEVDVDNAILCYNAQKSSEEINATNGAIQIHCSPNPFSNELFIEAEKKDLSAIYVYNIQGQLVSLKEGLSGSSTSLDLQKLVKGSYVLNILTKDGQSYREKIVKH